MFKDVYLKASICTIINEYKNINTNISNSQAHILFDSGAGVSISHPSVAKAYNFPIIKCDIPVKLNFANTTSAIARYYSDFGPILGRVLLSEEVSMTLINFYAIDKYNINI
jgi:hypothetical protein